MPNVGFAYLLRGPVHVACTIFILNAAARSFSVEAHGSSAQLQKFPRLLQSRASSCPVPQDVVFLVDSSATIGAPAFDKIKAFLVDVYQGLQIPPIRSGIIRFWHQHDIIAAMSLDKGTLLKAVWNMGYVQGETLLAPPLLTAQDVLINGTSQHKTVVVITDGDPNDGTDAKKRAAAMREIGIRLVVIVVGKAKTDYVREIVSTPVEDNIIRADSHSMLLNATGSLLRTLDLPCPCDPGLVVPVNISTKKQNENVTLKELLQHGQTTSMQCTDVASGYKGMVKLTCMNSKLFASHSCEQTCRDDNTNVLLIFNDERILLRPPKEMLNGGVEEVQCKDVIPGTVGTIELICEGGTLLVQHRCFQRCEHRMGSELSVNISHESSSVKLKAPQGGLDGGSLLLHQCEDHFANTTGSIGLTCFDGELRAAAQCTPRKDVQCPECVQCAECNQTCGGEGGQSSDGGVPIWTLPVYCVCSAFLGGLFMFFFQSRWQLKCAKIVIEPDPTTEQGMQTEPPPPPLEMHSRSTQVEGAKTTATGDLAVQTDPIMYAELMRGQQRAVDLVFIVDSSVSVGLPNFQKATDFLLELIHHFEMPAVRAGFIQFNDKVPFPDSAAITGDRAELEAKIKAMKYDIGETEMGPPLAAAAGMLEKVSSTSKKLIVVLTDGNPNDLDAVRHVVARLKNMGIRLMFVHVGALTTPSIMRELATAPADRNVVHLNSYDELLAAAFDVLAHVVEIHKCVRRMKCAASLLPYKVVPNIDAIQGTEIMCPGWRFTDCKDQTHWCWCWDGKAPIVHTQLEPWTPTTLSKPVLTKPASVDAPGTQLPVDVVYVVDSSASIGLHGFQSIKDFLIEAIQRIGMPANRVGLVQFRDDSPFLNSAAITGDQAQIEAKIRAMPYDITPTQYLNQANPLTFAAEMLEKVSSPSQKLILVLTDKDPNDLRAVREVTTLLKSKGIDLMFLPIAAFATPALPARGNWELGQLQLQIELRKEALVSEVDQWQKAKVAQELELERRKVKFEAEVDEWHKAQKTQLSPPQTAPPSPAKATSVQPVLSLQPQPQPQLQIRKLELTKGTELVDSERQLTHLQGQVAQLQKPLSETEFFVQQHQGTGNHPAHLSHLSEVEREQWYRAKLAKERLQTKAKVLKANFSP